MKFAIFCAFLFFGNVEPLGLDGVTILDTLNQFIRDSVKVVFERTGNNLNRKRNDAFWTRFPCNAKNLRSKERPTSVHKLRPGDIDVVAALGDSLTVGHGAAAKHFMQVLVENRGLSFSIGGQGTWDKFLTLPNILKELNPSLVGYSLGDSTGYDRASQFNVAEGAAMSRDLPFQAKLLIKRIRSDKRVNCTEDWKMVTIAIGANDYCSDSCYHPDPFSIVEEHRKDLIKALEYLRANMPRTIVNIVPPPHARLPFDPLPEKTFLCDYLAPPVVCSCMYGRRVRPSQRKEVDQVIRKWYQVEEEVSQDKRFKTTDDFAVVLQPFTVDLKFPSKNKTDGITYDTSVIAKDCTHLSVKGHAYAALGLWNNLLEPVGNKSLNWLDGETFPCPREDHPFIYTWKNSVDTVNISQITA